jgi:hypothetical protein
LLGAVKGPSDVAFSVGANSVLDFVGVLVNVDPVQERRVVADGSDQTLVLCIWEREEIS